MKATVLDKPFLGKNAKGETVIHTEGEIIDVSEATAKELEKNGLIIPSVDPARLVGNRTVRKATAGTGVPMSEVNPTTTLPTGGPTGEEGPALSSEEVQPRVKRAYRRRKGAPE